MDTGRYVEVLGQSGLQTQVMYLLYYFFYLVRTKLFFIFVDRNILSNECDDKPTWEDSIELEADPLRIMPCDNVSSSFNKTTTGRLKNEKSLRILRPSNNCESNKTNLEQRENGYIKRISDPSMSQTKNCDDDVDLFFKSIAVSVKKLRPELINEAKMKSLQMLFDLETRNNVR